jgi:hypothetical protein
VVVGWQVHRTSRESVAGVTHLATRCVLVRLRVSRWAPTRAYRGERGGLHRTLPPGARSALARIAADTHMARVAHHTRTLPWVDFGLRLLPTRNYVDYVTTIHEHRARFQRSVSDLVGYEGLHISPVVHQFATEFVPLPSADSFNVCDDLTPKQSSRLREAFTAQLSTIGELLTADVRDRIIACVTPLRDRVADYARVPERPVTSKRSMFREALFVNLRELTALVPGLNVMDDSSLAAAHLWMIDLVRRSNARVLRKSYDGRREFVQVCDGVLRDLGVIK